MNVLFPLCGNFLPKVKKVCNTKSLSHTQEYSALGCGILSSIDTVNHPQRAEAILNKISNIINKIYIGLISLLQGFQKCIA